MDISILPRKPFSPNGGEISLTIPTSKHGASKVKKPRKKIRQMGWGVRWRSSKIDFYHTKKEAQAEIDYWPAIKCVLFRCKIEEVTK